MNFQRHPHRVALALFASGVLGSSLAFACMYRNDTESILDVVRSDVIAAATAQSELRFTEAEKRYRRVVETTRTQANDGSFDPTQHVWALVQLGDVLENEGRIEEAESFYARALRLSKLSVSAYEESSILPLSHLRDLYISEGDAARAETARVQIDSIVTRVEPIYQNAVALQRKMKRGDGSLLADRLVKLANLYYERGDLERSEPLYTEVFAIRSRKGATGGGDVMGPLIRMGLANADAGKDAAATSMLQETLAGLEAHYGPKSPYLIKNLYNLGVLAYRQQRLEEADSLFSRVLGIEEARLGPDHPYSAPVLSRLAECSRDRGRFESARAYQLRVISIRSRVFGVDSRMVGTSLLALAEIEAASGDRAEAREVCEEALEIASKASGAEDPLAIQCLTTLDRLSKYTPDSATESDKPRT